MDEKKLINIEIKSTFKKIVWNRVIIDSVAPNVDDIAFYYRQLLGLGDDIDVSLFVENIPAEFNTALLSFDDSAAPIQFPVHDLQTPLDETDKRKKYAEFLHQMCEMERSRAAFRFFAKPTESSPAYEDDRIEHNVSKHVSKKKKWMLALLESLNPDIEYEIESRIIPKDDRECNTPYGWVLTPTCNDVRKEKGSRIILNVEVGQKWEQLLGTNIYPDLIISRRLNTDSWAFQHETSTTLVQSMVNWYIASKDTPVQNGISDFIVGCEEELTRLFTTFRKIKINEKFLTGNSFNDPTSQIYKLLSTVESRMLESANTNSLISPLHEHLFSKFMSYVFRGSGISKEMYSTENGINHIIQRWVRSNYGFRLDSEPILDVWNEMWSSVMRGNPTVARVSLFLTALDTWDPMFAAGLTPTDKTNISQEWIRIYLETQIIYEPKSKVKSIILQAQIKTWCSQFLPIHVFQSQLNPVGVGMVCTKRGLTSKKEKDGRYTHGIKFKKLLGEDVGTEKLATNTTVDSSCGIDECDTTEETIETSNNVQYSETNTQMEGISSQKRTITQTIHAEGNGARIDHFFAQCITKEEIHLGSL